MSRLDLHSNNVAALKLFFTRFWLLSVRFCEECILLFKLLPFSFPIYWFPFPKVFTRQRHLILNPQISHIVFTTCFLLTRQSFFVGLSLGWLFLKVFFAVIWWINGKEWFTMVLIFDFVAKGFEVVYCGIKLMYFDWLLLQLLL